MPTIYLSPSTQEYNPYVGGTGNEEYYMNLIADAMEPYLVSSGIQFTRNTPEMTAATSIQASNAGNYDLHLALHSNATGSGSASGSVRGTDVYYYPSSTEGQRAAEIIANNLQLIYPLPDRVRAITSTSIGEVSRTRAPGVLIEFAYHDNYADANWIRNNINAIAQNVVLSLCDFFDIPFIMPQQILSGTISSAGGSVNLRTKPDINSLVITTIPNGSQVTVYSQQPDWDVVGYNGNVGYVSSRFISF